MSKEKTCDSQMLLDNHVHIPSQRIILSGEVGQEMLETLMTGLILIEHKHKDKTAPIIELSSDGGCWYAGIGIYDQIRSRSYPVTVRVSGMAMSMGSIILQAGDKRLLGRYATVMCHDGQDVAVGTPENVTQWAKHGQNICNAMYGIYAERSGKTVAFWKKRCKKDFILSADEAIKLGLADGYM